MGGRFDFRGQGFIQSLEASAQLHQFGVVAAQFAIQHRVFPCPFHRIVDALLMELHDGMTLVELFLPHSVGMPDRLRQAAQHPAESSGINDAIIVCKILRLLGQ
jgi:hypothetical protein